MRLLALETAYDVCGAALVSDVGIEALEEQLVPRRHNEVLAPTVKRLLAETACQFNDLDGIALSAGPGSYTGLRVGMSYVKGLAFGTGLPVIPVPTLPSLLEGEEIDNPDWVATWSHGGNVYAVQHKGNTRWDKVRFMGWDKFARLAEGQTVAGYLLDRFQPGQSLTVLETCPSAVKVGKFALVRRLEPTSDLVTLVPDYHHEYQVRLSNYAHSGSL
ncbi:MAG: tRNA (adenosine(37)-N6)-threonylcarbamoyltransferase complex dimerization subunit type 1 TsaB [Fidelibacterota bacterium]|nr:MAG: tRNA (adenosine(37)-N6)-threonylcarbamoyltransferase complex dimerization subunit type 1 TsaB [Candidatus Neomarinimicrobiota bacterium]